jgi:hypothetical protein
VAVGMHNVLMGKRDRMALWILIGLVGLALIGLGVFAFVSDLNRTNQLAGVIGTCGTLVGLVVSWAMIASRRESRLPQDNRRFPSPVATVAKPQPARNFLFGTAMGIGMLSLAILCCAGAAIILMIFGDPDTSGPGYGTTCVSSVGNCRIMQPLPVGGPCTCDYGYTRGVGTIQ